MVSSSQTEMTTNYTSIDLIIGNILRKADPLSKSVISAFNATATEKANATMLSSSRFKLDSLERCATFLDIDIFDNNANMLFTNKASLAKRIVQQITALFPSICQDCNEEYHIEFDEETPPLYKCFTCFRGAHNCSAIKDRHENLKNHPFPDGLIWLCSVCHTKHNPVAPAKRVISRTDASENITLLEEEEKEEEDDETTNVVQPVTVEDHIATPHVPENNNDKSVLTSSQNNVRETVVCPLYKIRKCPHGPDGKKEINGKVCSDSHPTRCRKYCQNGQKGRYGCKLGVKCTQFHPVLCRYSVTKRLCTNKDCQYTHLKGTKRHTKIKDSDDIDNDKQPAPKKQVTQRQVPTTNTTQHGNKNSRDKDKEADKEVDKSDSFLELMGLIQEMKQQFTKEIMELKANVFHVRPTHNMVNPLLYNVHQHAALQHTQTHNKFPQAHMMPMSQIPQSIAHQSY